MQTVLPDRYQEVYAKNIVLAPEGSITPSSNNESIYFRNKLSGSGTAAMEWMQVCNDTINLNVDGNQYLYQSSKTVNEFDSKNGVFEWGKQQQFVWNIKVEFDESDFKDMDDGLLENIAKKLKVEAKDVKAKVLPKKSVASKVKSTLTKPKVVEEKKVEEPSEEESSDE